MDIANPFFSDLARGVEEVAAAAGYSVLLSDSAHDPDRERQRSSCTNSCGCGG